MVAFDLASVGFDLALGVLGNVVSDGVLSRFSKPNDHYNKSITDIYNNIRNQSISELTDKYDKLEVDHIETFLLEDNVQEAIDSYLKNPDKDKTFSILKSEFFKLLDRKYFDENEAELILNDFFQLLNDAIEKHAYLRDYIAFTVNQMRMQVQDVHDDVKDIKNDVKHIKGALDHHKTLYSSIPYRKPIQVPTLTESAVELPDIKKEIKDRLLDRENENGILTITAIQGLGGIGKTTLAIILANDKEVQKYYSDGILWITLGKEPDKLSLLYSWIEALGDYQNHPSSIDAASKHLRALLYEKSILLIIDDAWNINDIKPFLVGGSNCQTIVTTRKNYIADNLNAKSYRLDVMTEEQSLELFKIVLKDQWDEKEKENALEVAKDVAYLPLALKLAAKKRRRNYSWIKLHQALKEEIARLSVLESPRRLLRKEEENQESSLSLEASLNLSLKDLRDYDEKVLDCFIWLGVLPEDVKINEMMASTLWDTNYENAGEILEVLWEEGLLLDQCSTIQLENANLKTYSMHDLFHDIALHYLTVSADTKKATAILGLGFKLEDAHSSLLSHYQSNVQKKGLWHTLINDAYIHSHLTWHMEKAGDIESIHVLLSEENENGKNGWYGALDSLGLNAVFIEDLIRAFNLAEKSSENQIQNEYKSSSIGLEIRYALIYASINTLSAHIPADLLITLFETKKWTETKVFVYALKEPNLHDRVIKLMYVYQKATYESIKKDSLEQALSSALKIQNDYDRLEAFSFIVPHLDGQKKEEVIDQALSSAFKIQNDCNRSQALSFIVPHLDGQKKEEVIDQALFSASKIQNDYNRLEAFSFIVPYLDGQEKEEVIDQALSSAFKIQDEYYLSRAFSFIVPHLDGQKKEEVIDQALSSASKIQNNYYRLEAFSFIVPYLDGQKKEEVIDQALSSASKIQDDYCRSQALSCIISHLDGQEKEEVVNQTLSSAFKIQNEISRSRAFSFIVSHLDGAKKEEVIDLALSSASNIQDDKCRSQVLSCIAPHLDGAKNEDVFNQALSVASKIRDYDSQLKLLSSLVRHLDGAKKEEVIDLALSSASNIQDDKCRSQVLSFIVPHLDGTKNEEQIDQALSVASKIQVADYLLQSLSFIVPHLYGLKKEEVIDISLYAASMIEVDDEYRFEALSFIVPHLDGEKKEKAIDFALSTVSTIKGNCLGTFTKSLSSLVSHFDGAKRDEQIEHALFAISNIQNEYLLLQSLSCIVPHLDGVKKEDLIDLALSVASNIQNDDYRSQAFSYIIPHLDGAKKEEVIDLALSAAVSNIQDDYSLLESLSSIVPYLDGPKYEELINQTCSAGLKLDYDSNRPHSLFSLVVPLDGTQKEELIKKSFFVASKIQNEFYRFKVFSCIVSNLDGLKKEEMLEQILSAVSNFQDDYYTLQSLFCIVPHLDGLKEELFDQAFAVASNIRDDRMQSTAFSTMVPYLSSLPLNSQYSWWRKAIKVLRERTRKSLLMDISILIPVISYFGDNDAIFEISEAISDVSRWWP